MSAAEFEFWVGYHERNGFPLDRLEWSAAISGAYVGGSLGGKAKAKDLVPKFKRRQSPEHVMAWFDSLVPKVV